MGSMRNAVSNAAAALAKSSRSSQILPILAWIHAVSGVNTAARSSIECAVSGSATPTDIGSCQAIVTPDAAATASLGKRAGIADHISHQEEVSPSGTAFKTVSVMATSMRTIFGSCH
ncbi:hypothetical protein WG926_14150 [Tistrella sp. BH-R2-4]|uniref:Uncharacterized protein n=1 Tax=Tistrella arctica TaxID=3133430 RepID=A0ABU9YKZ3_9PROT